MVGPTLLVEVYNMKKPLTREDERLDTIPDATSTFDDEDLLGVDLELDDMLDHITMSDVQQRALENIEKNWNTMTRAAGGVVVRMADREEFNDIQDFIAHVQDCEIELRDDPEDATVKHAMFRDGPDGDLLEAGYHPLRGTFTFRRVNGEWPYLPVGISRDTPLSIQGDTGDLRKNGAVLRSKAGMMAFLQTEPITKSYLALNPLPDLNLLSLTTAEGVEVTTDGLLGIARIHVQNGGEKICVCHALKPDQTEQPGLATALLIFGSDEAPSVSVNEQKFDAAELRSVEIDGRRAWLAPLADDLPDDTDAIIKRYRESRALIGD